ncbi:MAG: hypothetical protein NT006_02115 [Candidatus Aminicenantes bacterium]|nr:hypothetical protein [Candidatus Aminicenantes bacterium]
MKTAISVLKVLASWPVIVLILVLIFRDKVGNLLDRLKKAGPLEWGQSPADELPKGKVAKQDTQIELESDKRDNIKWEKVASIYWAGHDVMWTCDVILRNAPRDIIVWGLGQSLHHIREIGLINDPIEVRSSRLLVDARTMLEKDWTPQVRNDYVRELLSVREYVGSLMNAHQKGFKPRPE